MEDKRNTNECSPQTCQYHVLTESVISDLKDAVQKLMEGQEQMRTTLIQLAESFRSIERLEARVGKMEDMVLQKDKDQDKKIEELRAFMYKVTGVVTVALAIVPAIIGYLMP
jgi:hypothetical protein